jgi:ABC-type polysaccharide/polyol phosphate transport system ATPase subunit
MAGLSKGVEPRTRWAHDRETTRTTRVQQDVPAISVRDLEKRFVIPQHRPVTLKERALHPFRRFPKVEVTAARSISYEVRKGECFGIVGRNGSGKSTLLKLLAGIYRADRGTIEIRGRVSPLIELAVGFNPELAAKDNVVINGTLLGLSRAQIHSRFDSIIEFAELEEFTELKLKNYSSGMLVRLAFATAIQVDGDVILLDEVLAVGDAGFQEKCFDAFRKLKDENRTIVLVTHDMDAVQRHCDRAMMIEDGEIVSEGDPEEVSREYQDIFSEHPSNTEEREPGRWGNGAAEIVDAWIEGPGGVRVSRVRQGEQIAICAEFKFHEEIERPVYGISLRDPDGHLAFNTNTTWQRVKTADARPGSNVSVRFTLQNDLGVGRWYGTIAVAYRDMVRFGELRTDAVSFVTYGNRTTGAAFDVPHEIEIW